MGDVSDFNVGVLGFPFLNDRGHDGLIFPKTPPGKINFLSKEAKTWKDKDNNEIDKQTNNGKKTENNTNLFHVKARFFDIRSDRHTRGWWWTNGSKGDATGVAEDDATGVAEDDATGVALRSARLGTDGGTEV